RGDPRANCTRGNGVQDTEDLNGNGVLDTDERVFRQVVRLDDPRSPYLARDSVETRTGFRLYRVPLRRETAVGATPAEIHNVRLLRLTVVGEGSTSLALARMRLVGSRWEKRGEGGVVGGLLEAERPAAFLGRLEAGPVSRLTDGDAYLSPPGVVDQPQDPGAAFELAGGVEFNEKALRLRYSGVAAGDRAEVYRSYDGTPRNFLAYRQLRLWALAREGRWGTGEGGEQLVVRVGSGPDNYYLYRTPLPRVGAPRAPQDWGPEIVIDFAPWQRLRAEAERRLLDRPAGDTQPLVLWDADSTYAVVVGERGRAPNLAAVRELSLAVWNSGGGIASGELWINDLRLGAAESRPGAAGELNLAIRGGGVLQTDLSYTHQGAHFRQLDALPGYQGEGMLSLSSALQLGELLPGGWRLHAPLAVSHQRTAAEPLYVEQTDLDASLLGGVRRPEGQRTRITFQLGRRNPDRGGGIGLPASEGLRLRVAYQSADEATPYTALRGEDLDIGVEYHLRPAARTLRLLREGLGGWAWLASLRGLRLRWSPESFTLSTGWSDRRSEYQSFSHVLLSESHGGAARQSLQQRLHQQASLQFRPFASLGADLMLRSTRDLLPSSLLNPQATERLDAERLRLAGLDLGREADRSLTTRLTWAPRLSEWLTAQATASGSFVLDQNPAYYRIEGITDGLAATGGPHPLP
ncbi:MAG TPA: hypothetical protein VGR27_01445, partial [Longimicrobiaceae bacterium]|nr:hypothetical protein [Longimicrobiaceae bacterium]